jgi:hypothetical protein
MKAVLIFILMCVMSFTSVHAGEYPRNELIGTAGWGAPVGFGIEFAKYLNRNLNLNAGFGLTITGFKLSMGTKYIAFPADRVSPYIGINFSHSSGIGKLRINVNTDTAKYKMKAANIVTPRVGLKVKNDFANIYLNAGFGIVTSGGGKRYLSGSRDSSVEDFASLLSAGGIEISGSISFPIQ